MPPFASTAIKETFAAFPRRERTQLLALRDLIYDTAAATPESGKIVESLKWGQPSFATVEPVSGTPIRLGIPKGGGGTVALYVHCGTRLIDTFKSHYAGTLRFQAKRAVLFDASKPLPTDAVRHCIALALTYRSK
ncbi:MAG: DUF1801 domain-containing protein [Alphaproteobacteria bacterium]